MVHLLCVSVQHKAGGKYLARDPNEHQREPSSDTRVHNMSRWLPSSSSKERASIFLRILVMKEILENDRNVGRYM